MPNQYTAIPLEQRFWDTVDRSVGPDTCWIWPRKPHPRTGYIQTTAHGRLELVHRLAWILTHGAIPEGMMVCHRCDVRQCVNPAHLFLGTHRDNMDDMREKGRAASGERNSARLYPNRVARGERQGRAVLTDAIVRDIRARYASGTTRQSALAREYGLNRHIVWAVIHRKTWRHI